jgi:hypothetical protein
MNAEGWTRRVGVTFFQNLLSLAKDRSGRVVDRSPGISTHPLGSAFLQTGRASADGPLSDEWAKLHDWRDSVGLPVDDGRSAIAGVRKLFRLIQLEQVAERIVEEGLAPGAGDERGPVHLDALLLQVGDGRIYVVDSDREVVRTELLRVGLHQVHLLAAGVEPVSRAEIGARQLRHAEHVAIKSETLLCVGDTDGDMVHTGWLHHSILPRTLEPCMTFRIARHV